MQVVQHEITHGATHQGHAQALAGPPQRLPDERRDRQILQRQALHHGPPASRSPQHALPRGVSTDDSI